MGFNGIYGGLMGSNGIYPLVMTNKKLLKMAIEIVDLPINSMVMFHSYVSLPEGSKC